MKIDVALTPSEFQRIGKDDLQKTVCVVFDVLRATSVMVTALYNGAKAIIPAASIEEALSIKQEHPNALLAGERDGFKISPSLTGGIEFDLGNSPREFTHYVVKDKIIITTTTNGTRAIKTVKDSKLVLISSFLNLSATSEYIIKLKPSNLLIICSGSKEQLTSEDVLAAGALVYALMNTTPDCSDSAIVTRDFYLFHKQNLTETAHLSAHARKLLQIPELADDIAFCLRKDVFNLTTLLKDNAIVPVC